MKQTLTEIKMKVGKDWAYYAKAAYDAGSGKNPFDALVAKRQAETLKDASKIWHEGYMDGPNDNTA